VETLKSGIAGSKGIRNNKSGTAGSATPSSSLLGVLILLADCLKQLLRGFLEAAETVFKCLSPE